MIIDQLQQKFPDMPNLRVRDITVDKLAKKVTCAVSYPNAKELPAETASDIRATVEAAVPVGYRCSVRFVNDSFNEKSFVALILDVIKKKYPLFGNVKADKIAVKISGQDIFAEFSVSENTKRNMEVSNFTEELSEFLHSYTCYKIRLSVTVDASYELQKSAVAEQEKLVQLAINRELLKPQRYFNVRDVVKHIGKEILTKPMYISDIRAPMETCVVCGVISEKELRAVKSNPTLKLCKFNLTDGSAATIPCVMFARFQIDDYETLKQTNGDKPDSEILTISKKKSLSNDKKMKMLAFLSNGLEVIVRGKVVYSDFSERLELQLYDICKCRIESLNLQPKFEREAPQNYVLVHPQPIEEYRQLSFEQLEEKPSVLTNKDYVTLYANVTGNNVAKDKIYAIGAVRVSNGHLTEKFCTFVSPETTVSEEKMKAANVTTRQLAISPTITEIIGDLFKFVGDATLVGVNLDVLMTFLNYYGAPLGYNFKNATESQTAVLSALFEHSVFDTRPNCSLIDEVVKFLKLDCRVANSAEDMAVALARCMSALGRNAI